MTKWGFTGSIINEGVRRNLLLFVWCVIYKDFNVLCPTTGVLAKRERQSARWLPKHCLGVVRKQQISYLKLIFHAFRPTLDVKLSKAINLFFFLGGI